MEQINCQYCGADVEIKEDSVCKCGVELLLSQSLRDRIKSLEAQIIALRLEQGKAVSELCRRERMRNIKAGRNPSYFWQGVVGKPSWASRPKSPPARTIQINMADFD